MTFNSGQDLREAPPIADGENGTDAVARDLLFIERLKFGQAELASERVFVCGLLHDAVASAKRKAGERQVEISVNRCDRVISSKRGDRRRLMQAFDHLIDNAVQYSPPGATVQVAGMLLDRRFVVEIEDDGPGIPAEERELIYDAFFRGAFAREKDIPGRGIGLAVARAIIEAHGGSLRVGDNTGGGTTAFVELPA